MNESMGFAIGPHGIHHEASCDVGRAMVCTMWVNCFVWWPVECAMSYTVVSTVQYTIGRAMGHPKP